MYDTDQYQRAARRVKQIRDFYVHLTVYILVNLGLFVLDMTTSPHSTWFYWPALIWGIGLVAHGVAVYGPLALMGSDWEERKIREIVESKRTR